MADGSKLIEIEVKNHVKKQLKDCSVYMEYPEGEAPDYFLVLDRTDGSRSNHILSGTFVVRSYGPTKVAAAMLHEKTKAAMDSLYALPRIAGCELIGDYPFPDEKHKRHRYQAVYRITYY